ncbi:MAG: AsmA-like C-terminal region-containing protein [Actinomycetota bacterium]
MRLVRKIALFAGGFLLLAIMVPGLYAVLNQDKLTGALTRKVNESVNTKISYGDLRITIFESFPNITVKFIGLLVEPSPFYDRTQFRFENLDTLLYASSLSLTVSMPSLLTGTVAVKSITARDGEVNLLTDKRGDINYEVFTEKKEDGKNVRLKNITASNIRAVFSDRSSGIRVSGRVNQANLGGEIFRTGIYLNTSLNALLDSASIENTTFRDIPVEAGIRLRKSPNSLSVARGSLAIADLKFDITGNVNYSASTLNISIEGKKISISSLISRLPDKWRAFTGNFSPVGIIDLKCAITGQYGEAGKPHIEINYGLSGGKMNHSASGFRVNNLEFNGAITNGDHNSAETFRFTMDNLTAGFGSASVRGSFMLNNLNRPHVTLALDGDLDFNDLGRIFRSGYIENQTGSVSGSVRLSGIIPDSSRVADALPFMKPDISLNFKNFGASLADRKLILTNVNGSLTVKNDLIADSLSFNYRDQRFTLNAVLKNFVPWVSGRPEILDISGNLHTDRLVTSMFIAEKRDTAATEDKPSDLFPADVTASVAIRADSLIFNNFRAAGFSSRLIYKPYVITFGEAKAEGLDGSLTGEFMLSKQKDGGYITRTNLNVRGIDINKAFTSFNNFGQDFIVNDNLRGRLTGNLALLAPLDGNYKVLRKAMVAEAHLLINEGRLVNFAPAESLSSYLDLDELKDISFSKLENDLYINNGTVSIPKMLINSSAVNFTAYGTHGFDGDYSYHVRLLLSEVLSRKARERNRGVSSFGQVRVDGSGKATVPLKIECINDKISVGYDFGQAQDNIKSDIAIEKQSLKGILNEEYGWYETDTTRTRPQESKPKFTITWEEGREQPAATEQQQEAVKESPIRILLKKKK